MWSISFIDAAVKRRTRIITVVGIDENDKKDGSTMLWGGNFSKAPNAQPFFLQKVDLVFTSTSIASSGSCESGHRENALWVAAADPAPFHWAPHPGYVSMTSGCAVVLVWAQGRIFKLRSLKEQQNIA